MTRKESIDHLKNMLGINGFFGDAEKKALKIAIAALEAEPCEDTISRKAALEKAINVPIAKVVTEDKVIYRKIVFADDIENLPSVTPKQRTGHWKSTIDEKSHHWVFRCDKCGWIQETTTNYCPDCGKRMVEPQENCDTCKHKDDGWDSEHCDGCCEANSKWSGECYPGEFEAMEHNGRLDALENEEISREEIAALLASESEE